MHDMLFERQDTWAGQENATEIFAGFADELGLDGEAFSQCLDSNKYESAVLAEMQEGAGLGVTGTPAFFINGRLLSGAQPYAAFEQAVEAAAAE
jgi:protein-disulfide isomerase